MSSPLIASQLVERVLSKLGFSERPPLNLAGLNVLFAAFCSGVPADNIRKRIWFAGDQTTPLPGGDPTDFFEYWLAHGTGGTCWPINGALYALLQSTGFDIRRIAGTMIVEGYAQVANHGSVLATHEGIDYLVDAQIAAFQALPLVPSKSSSTGEGIHDISAVHIGDRFEVLWFTGHNREKPIPFRTRPEYDRVDHAFFLHRYDRSKSDELSPFNQSLHICRHFTNFILTVGRKNKMTVAADGSFTKTEITDAERKRVLVDDLGLSEEIVEMLPPDTPGDTPFF